MLTLTVVNGPGAPALSARFDELGGTIGRADSNLLVLPDPGRTISRVHAQVVFRRGAYVLLDRGSNPVLLNGEPLVDGPSRELANDDRVQLGAYTLRVDLRALQGTSPDADAPTVLDLRGRVGGPGRTGLAGTGGLAGHAGVDEVDRIIRPAIPAHVPREPQPSPAIDPFAAFGDLDAWNDAGNDPLGLGPAPPPSRAAAPATLPMPAADLDVRPERRALESMFGIDEGGPLGDPLGDAFGDPLGDPLGSVTRADAHADDWRQAFHPKAAPTDALDELTLERPVPPTRPTPTASPVALAPPFSPVSSSASPPGAAPAPAPATSQQPPLAATDEVAAALAQGLGLPRDQLPALTPDLALLIGELLRDAVAGTVDMLHARATLKREVQAAATMIATRDNNPLKFSPNVDVALRHLLQPTVSGFLAPRAAMRDAVDDLRAHQVGLVAGMQGASSRVLRRLAPERMAERLRAPSLLDKALPMNRKAALWERFVDEYERLGQEADEAFQAAFAQAFRAAYEEHFETLRQAGR
ncbi:type VI secretion system-associated FHA domain protein TagH [Mitsuaria sp. CC2]|uniref:type VI secretion system-associated FHA domain protein TagH n=1 Tax=Mitsuaria sp. CC2 TaxID=3029186 RepID=UPI003B8CF5C9